MNAIKWSSNLVAQLNPDLTQKSATLRANSLASLVPVLQWTDEPSWVGLVFAEWSRNSHKNAQNKRCQIWDGYMKQIRVPLHKVSHK